MLDEDTLDFSWGEVNTFTGLALTLEGDLHLIEDLEVGGLLGAGELALGVALGLDGVLDLLIVG